jgi:hypothetical protein
VGHRHGRIAGSGGGVRCLHVGDLLQIVATVIMPLRRLH